MKTIESPEKRDEEIKERLLQLIEDGDPTIILSSEFTESLNELIKYEFVSIEDERLQLTEKGQQAKLQGLKDFLVAKAPMTEEIKLSDIPQQKLSSGISNQAFLLLLIFFSVSLLAMIFLIQY